MLGVVRRLGPERFGSEPRDGGKLVIVTAAYEETHEAQNTSSGRAEPLLSDHGRDFASFCRRRLIPSRGSSAGPPGCSNAKGRAER